jgi:hypothetical protein
LVDDNHLTDYWRFTVASFLTGMAHEELTSDELEVLDSRSRY